MRGVRRRCQKIVETLDLPQNFSAELFCAKLANQRGRPIVLMPLPIPTSPELPTGMWYASETTDYIFFDSQTSQYHREHIILHEVGHMLFGHCSPDIDDDTVRYRDPIGLPRISYSTREEQEAEMLATMLLLRGRRRHGYPVAGAPGVLSDAVGTEPWC